MNHIFSISPYFKGQDESHIYWFEESLKAVASRNGYAYSTCASVANPELNVSNCLTFKPVNRHKITFFPWLFIWRDVSAISSKCREVSGKPLIHVYDGGFREFITLILLLQKNQCATGVFNFTTLNPWIGLFEKATKVGDLSRKMLQRVKDNFGARLRLFADSLELVDALESRKGDFQGEYPMFSFITTDPSKVEKDNYVLLCPANAREFDLCMGAIEFVNSRVKEALDWTIQMRWGGKPNQASIDSASRNKVRLVTEFLAAGDYVKLYDAAKVVVLPYLDRNYYKFQSSGRLLDSVKFGAKVVVPDNTVLSRKTQSNAWGHSFHGDSPESMGKSLIMAISEAGKPNRNQPNADSSFNVLFSNPALGDKSKSSFAISMKAAAYFSIIPLIYRLSMSLKKR